MPLSLFCLNQMCSVHEVFGKCHDEFCFLDLRKVAMSELRHRRVIFIYIVGKEDDCQQIDQ
jgi:hypothetical protein